MNRTLLLKQYSPTWLGQIIECHPSVPSTNDRARDILDQLGPAAHGAVVMAEEQTGGRGRHGRSWHSPRGVGLALSVALWNEGPSDRAVCLPLAGSLAVLRALHHSAGLRGRLKWPNDVLVGGKKVSGVLVESRVQGDRPSGLVLGIGVNLLHREEDFPDDLRSFATSVRLAGGRPVTEEAFAASLLVALSPLLEEGLMNPAALVEKASGTWAHEPGDLLDVSSGEEILRGTFAGIAPDGSLLLKVDGRIQAVHHGDVTRVRPGGPRAGILAKEEKRGS